MLPSAFVLEPALQCLLHEVKHLERAEAGSFTRDAPLLFDDATLEVGNLQLPASRLVFNRFHRSSCRGKLQPNMMRINRRVAV